ncbi:MAG: protein-methionine-sulfoxide reductase catalytic subunit MsrP [Lysobacteraceae bacterium]|nr:MAG: protein-methionine-sulfoxide reductase catalytic subunit MsrP [Xanthomonadaceae bacterium]
MPQRPDADLREKDVTPEWVYRRRRLLGGALGLGALSLAACADGDPAGDEVALADPGEDPFRTRETLTRFEDATSYNNFYEFGTGKADPARHAHRLVTRPWSLAIEGEAERTGVFALEDILARTTQVERIYRLRCVEGWSMVIPWQGFELRELLALFRPTSRARYVAFTTLADPAQMPGLRFPVLDWPYVEGLRIDEAMHPLTLVATGMYGRTLPNQNGAPLRLVVPWKYGFKSIKSIVRIRFVEEQPATSWNRAQPDEYGFYSNVNPEVDHPRWSQKTERRLAGSGNRLLARRIPTLPFNGYATQVASLYAGMDLRRHF